MNPIFKKTEILKMIFTIRGRKVLIDSDLADLYVVETKQLNRAVSRNIERFPEDFMFRLNDREFENLKYHFGTSSSWGGRRRSLPRAFTEQGVAMLSGVLRSKEAVKVNISIMRAFVYVNYIIRSNKKVIEKLMEIENRMNKLEDKTDSKLSLIHKTLQELIIQEEKPETPIGFDLGLD
ncbi:ORF6N domain-containing protein [Candidatus Dojkabacteria bacterium]|nr:ORF6N domain-containing protein [Candidatus Dojkabacteria bacterium]